MVTVRLPVILFLVCSIFLSFSCNSTDKVANSEINNDLFKPMDIYGVESTTPHPYVHTSNFWWSIEQILTRLTDRLTGEQWEICYFFAGGILLQGPDPDPGSNLNIEQAYIFRDNYLINSKKGNDYIISYYLLSQYGIKNNLVTKYPTEHLALLKNGINISKNLQNDKYDFKVIIDYSDYEQIKYMTEIYRNSVNHAEIDPILDYLENDLDNFLNKTKGEIRIEFEN